MEILCILTLGIKCGGAFNNTDNDWNAREHPPIVGAAPVPEPGAALLFGVGLATAGVVARRGRKF